MVRSADLSSLSETTSRRRERRLETSRLRSRNFRLRRRRSWSKSIFFNMNVMHSKRHFQTTETLRTLRRSQL